MADKGHVPERNKLLYTELRQGRDALVSLRSALRHLPGVEADIERTWVLQRKLQIAMRELRVDPPES